MAFINLFSPYNLVVGPELFTITESNIVSAAQDAFVLRDGINTYTYFGNFVVSGSYFTPDSAITAFHHQTGGVSQMTASGFYLPMSEYDSLTDNETTATDLLTRVLSLADNIRGSIGADVIYGFSGNDYIEGNGGNDLLNGHFGNDIVNGDSGNDIVRGGSGNDTLDGGSGNDTVRGDKGNDLIRGGDGNDYVNGHEGNDIVRGGYGNDLVRGGSENDVIIGEFGDDRLYGDRGNDLLAGAQGADIFYFSANSGIDRIADFETADSIAIYGISGVTSFAELVITESGGDSFVDFGGGNQVIVDNYVDLNAGDFVFA